MEEPVGGCPRARDVVMGGCSAPCRQDVVLAWVRLRVVAPDAGTADGM